MCGLSSGLTERLGLGYDIFWLHSQHCKREAALEKDGILISILAKFL